MRKGRRPEKSNGAVVGRPPVIDAVRRRTMSRIKSKGTSIEVSLRKALWRSGVRYKKNYGLLLGSPDIVVPKYQVAIFCDEEFWHGKDWETKKGRLKGNREYWIAKIERNIARDQEVERQLYGMGWTVIRFWGGEIEKDVEGCVKTVRETILRVKLENSRVYAWGAGCDEWPPMPPT